MHYISSNSIEFSLVRTCSANYYTNVRECDVLCLISTAYHCDNQGNKICKEG